MPLGVWSPAPEKMQKKQTTKYGIALLVTGYLLVCAYMYAQQGRLMYHPEQHAVAPLLQAVSGLPAGSGVDVQRHAIVVEPNLQPSKGTVIFFHGNSGNAWKYLAYHQQFNAMGYRMVLAEYPGFGWRSGQPNEQQIVNEGVALYEHWRRSTPQDQPVMLVGKSLGTGVATQVAARASMPPSKVVLLTPFTSITEVASQKYWMLPVAWLLKDHFASDQHLHHYTGPVSILVAGQDEVIGSATGLKLLAQAKSRGPADLMMKTEANHNSWMPRLTATEWQQLLHWGMSS